MEWILQGGSVIFCVEIEGNAYSWDFRVLAFEEFSIRTHFRQRWQDRRLAIPEQKDILVLSFRHLDYIWKPDTFFEYEKRSRHHTLTVPNVLLTLSPEGWLTYSQRVTLVHTCEFHLEAYPFDSQSCPVRILSYSDNASHIQYSFHNLTGEGGSPVEGFSDKHRDTQASQLAYRLGPAVPLSCDTVYGEDLFSCRGVSLRFQRFLSAFLWRCYAPSALTTMLSFTAHWLDSRNVNARVQLRAQHVDTTARVLFPAVFLCFNLYVFVHYYLATRWQEDDDSRSSLQFICDYIEC